MINIFTYRSPNRSGVGTIDNRNRFGQVFDTLSRKIKHPGLITPPFYEKFSRRSREKILGFFLISRLEISKNMYSKKVRVGLFDRGCFISRDKVTIPSQKCHFQFFCATLSRHFFQDICLHETKCFRLKFFQVHNCVVFG